LLLSPIGWLWFAPVYLWLLFCSSANTRFPMISCSFTLPVRVMNSWSE
jgi:hypothetical protein